MRILELVAVVVVYVVGVSVLYFDVDGRWVVCLVDFVGLVSGSTEV